MLQKMSELKVHFKHQGKRIQVRYNLPYNQAKKRSDGTAMIVSFRIDEPEVPAEVKAKLTVGQLRDTEAFFAKFQEQRRREQEQLLIGVIPGQLQQAIEVIKSRDIEITNQQLKALKTRAEELLSVIADRTKF